MSRIIKFRAWDNLNKRWLLGYEYPKLGGFSMMGEVMMSGEYTGMLNSFSLKDWDEIKLMQFTGLKDKNGKEIYEGDIIKDWNGIREVNFTIGDNMQGYDLETDDTDLEVLGNIYEHSNLLNK